MWLGLQLLHAAAGVEKGKASKNGMPVEVMGFIVGHLSTDDEHTLCVTDVRYHEQAMLCAILLSRSCIGAAHEGVLHARRPFCRHTRWQQKALKQQLSLMMKKL